jgi:hypothetical protein
VAYVCVLLLDSAGSLCQPCCLLQTPLSDQREGDAPNCSTLLPSPFRLFLAPCQAVCPLAVGLSPCYCFHRRGEAAPLTPCQSILAIDLTPPDLGLVSPIVGLKHVDDF